MPKAKKKFKVKYFIDALSYGAKILRNVYIKHSMVRIVKIAWMVEIVEILIEIEGAKLKL